MTKQEGLIKVKELVARFGEQLPAYKKSDYNETQTRRDFIDPFFKALGWDIDNEQGFAESYREVIHEDKVKVGKATKAPDYSFRLGGGKRLFFVEAKKPSVAIKDDIQPAYQVRRYGWSAKLNVSIITDFEEFAIYDCTKKPNPTDKSSVARVKYFTYDNYETEWDFIWNTFSKEAVLKGTFDKFIVGTSNKKGTATVDKEFLTSLDQWRTLLAENISKDNKQLDEDELNFAVQQTLDRIIFLRICEDRSIEPYGSLADGIKTGDYYQNLLKEFKQADDKYNSGLFDFKKDNLSHQISINNKTLKTIINQLYYPECPYEFSVLSVEILGSAYEQFLGKTITINNRGKAVIELKPEVRKAGGVYYTPQYIVDYIVENTIGNLTKGKTPKQVEEIKIVDPACGSGSFLLGAYQYLLNWHLDYYKQNPDKKSPLTIDGNLTTAQKKKILLNNIFGVDIDTNAVEVTKLSLLLKCMEGETQASIANQMTMFNERVLPTLENNIKSGNSLIDIDYYDIQIDFGEEKKIKPFSWQKAFPSVFKNGGFDVVIGNPPYVRIHELGVEIKNYFKLTYSTADNQYDLYQLFYEKCLEDLCNENGLLGYITPNKFCITNYGQKLRTLIFEKYTIETIVDCTTAKVFGNVSTYPFIFILKRKLNKNKNVKLIKDIGGSFSDFNIEPQKKLLRGKEKTFAFDNDEASSSLVEKLESKREESIFEVYRGRGTSKDITTNGAIATISNKEISRYSDFVKINYRQKSKYQTDFDPKIVMKKICYNIESSLDISGKINPINTVYIIKPINDKINIYTLLGIFNSKLLSYYARNKFASTAMRGGYIELRVFEVASLPICIPSNQASLKIQNYVIEILQLNKELQNSTLSTKADQIKTKIEYLEDKIDELVYNIYDLTEEEIKIINQ